MMIMTMMTKKKKNDFENEDLKNKVDPNNDSNGSNGSNDRNNSNDSTNNANNKDLPCAVNGEKKDTDSNNQIFHISNHIIHYGDDNCGYDDNCDHDNNNNVMEHKPLLLSTKHQDKEHKSKDNIQFRHAKQTDPDLDKGDAITFCSTKTNNKDDMDDSKTMIISKKNQHQRIKSVFYMTLAMAIHFAGYEFTRSPTMSMFISKDLGFTSSAILPLAVGCVSPFSILILYLYSKVLHKHGPRYALKKSTILGASFMFFIGYAIYTIKPFTIIHRPHEDYLLNSTHMANITHIISKCLLFTAFVFQSANVQFLYTQHWSFIGSVLTPNEIAASGSLIAGIGSITSTIAAAYVSTLVHHIGLIGSYCTAAILIGSSAFFADQAYQISNEYGFEPTSKNNDTSSNHRNNHNIGTANTSTNSGVRSTSASTSSTLISIHGNHSTNNTKCRTNGTNSNNDNNNDHKKKKKSTSTSQPQSQPQIKNENIIETSKKLVNRVPVLGAMFCEVIIAQCLSSLLNFQFVTEVKNGILNDEDRAGFTGNCYAYVNGISGSLQFFILPFVVKKIGAKCLWLIMPITMLILISLQLNDQKPSLTLVGLTFLAMKTIEYSLRGQASEMIWVMLDYESRFIGKELINLFANRLGKSATAISLFLWTVHIDQDEHHLRKFAIHASIVLAILWLIVTIRLTRLIPTKETVVSS